MHGTRPAGDELFGAELGLQRQLHGATARGMETATADLCGHKKMVKGQGQFALTAIRDVRNGQDTDMNALRWRAVHLKSSPSYLGLA